MRKQMIAGNWKMHGKCRDIQLLVDGIKQGMEEENTIDVLVLPSFIHLSFVKNLLNHSNIHLGAQNLYVGDQGAFTGEVSATMLADLGCEYVLIGHSERRIIFKEDLALVAAKFKTAVNANLKPILCVGETQTERENNQTNEVIAKQLLSVIEEAGIDAFQQAIIAYEPVWAIGTGLTAKPDEAQAVHASIRQHLAKINVDLARTIRILYGGSMKAENAALLLKMPDIDGGLIGGASLEAKSFLSICNAASQEASAAKTH